MSGAFQKLPYIDKRRHIRQNVKRISVLVRLNHRLFRCCRLNLALINKSFNRCYITVYRRESCMRSLFEKSCRRDGAKRVASVTLQCLLNAFNEKDDDWMNSYTRNCVWHSLSNKRFNIRNILASYSRDFTRNSITDSLLCFKVTHFFDVTSRHYCFKNSPITKYKSDHDQTLYNYVKPFGLHDKLIHQASV